MSRRFIKIALSATTAALLAVGGVLATWTYAESGINDLQISPVIEMGIFNWEGAEILPDDVLGENHQILINELIDGEEGMNAEENSEINQQIKERQDIWWAERDTFGSMDAYDSTAMENLFGLESSNLSFMIYFPDATPQIRYIFTTSVDLGEAGYLGNVSPNVPIGEYVYVVYRTTLTLQDGEWVAQKSEIGYAASAYYQNDGLGSLVIQCPAFDVGTWRAGELGEGFDDAIYAFVGETDSAYTSSAEKRAYYKIVVQTAQTLTVSSTKENVTITVYDQNKNEVEKQKDEASNTFSWQATAQTYYFSLVGDTAMDFSITVN